MADRDGRSSELVFCHACENEWLRSEHGLECPECHSDVVEIIDPNSDPREETTMHDDTMDLDDRPPPYGSSRSNTWGTTAPASGTWGMNSGAPDPDEDDISHVQYGGRSGRSGGGGGGGISYSSTTYVRSGPGMTTQTTRVVNGADLFPQLLSNILGVTQQQQPHGQQGYQPGQPQDLPPPGAAPRSPLQEGPFRMGSPPRLQSSIRITTSGFGAGGGGTRTQNVQSDDIMGIFGSILQGIGGGQGGFPPGHPGQPGQQGQPPNPFGFLAQMLNPANARAGDAVYTNEALDRVISQLMEQHQGSNAPGPATEAAINALPKREITKADLGENGLADCSICMEGVEVGSEVTELPCKHWFHNDCVAPWLHEHDTCPQCRRGITPQEGDQNTPRATGQAPRHWQMSEADFRANLSSPTGEQPPPAPPPPPPAASNLSPGAGQDPSPDRSHTGSSPRRSGLGSLMDRFRHSSGGSGGSGGSDARSH